MERIHAARVQIKDRAFAHTGNRQCICFFMTSPLGDAMKGMSRTLTRGSAVCFGKPAGIFHVIIILIL